MPEGFPRKCRKKYLGGILEESLDEALKKSQKQLLDIFWRNTYVEKFSEKESNP